MEGGNDKNSVNIKPTQEKTVDQVKQTEVNFIITKIAMFKNRESYDLLNEILGKANNESINPDEVEISMDDRKLYLYKIVI